MEFYNLFEDRFRGSTQSIRERQSVYLPLIEHVDPEAPNGRRALDLGSGRGEWLALISEHGWFGIGVDSNLSMAEASKSLGVDTIQMEALEYLQSCDNESFGLITAFHLVEHIPTDALIELLSEIERVLIPGGILVLETPNPENLTVSSWSFYMDPTHRQPLPPLLLQFLVQSAGFVGPEILRLNSHGPKANDLPAMSAIAALFLSSPDYSVVASKPGGSVEGLAGSITAFVSATSHRNPAALDPLLAEISCFEQCIAATNSLPAQTEQLASELVQARGEAEHLRAKLREAEMELASLRAELQSELKEARQSTREMGRAIGDLAAGFDRLSGTLEPLQGLQAWNHQTAWLARKAERVERELQAAGLARQDAEQQLQAILNSTSWRVTAGLRTAKRATKAPASHLRLIYRPALKSAMIFAQRRPALKAGAKRLLGSAPTIEAYLRRFAEAHQVFQPARARENESYIFNVSAARLTARTDLNAASDAPVTLEELCAIADRVRQENE